MSIKPPILSKPLQTYCSMYMHMGLQIRRKEKFNENVLYTCGRKTQRKQDENQDSCLMPRGNAAHLKLKLALPEVLTLELKVWSS